MKIIFPGITYDEALSITNVQTLKTRRQELTNKLFQEIFSNNSHRLYSILPSRNFSVFNLRNKHEYNVHFQT
jgi:hypothetical protein